MHKTRLLLSLSLVLGGCAFKPEDAGLCKLNCSNAIISGNDAQMTFVPKSVPSSITCAAASAGQVISDPIFAQFLIAEAFDNGTDTPGQRPVPSISVEPIVNGLRSDLPQDNPNVEADGSAARYRGIITPKNNWCSDTCGVVTLEVAAVCPPAGSQSDVTIQFHSGALYSDPLTFPTATLAP